MLPVPVPDNETERLKALKGHQLLDTLPEEAYDNITKIASEICGTPIALLTLVDEKRQWFKAKVGMEGTETSREHAFCAYTILNPDEVLVVEDARFDERFHDNPFTIGDPHVVFYAGVPVKDSEGHALGSLCVIDNRPRELSQQKIDALKGLSQLVSSYFKLRKADMEIEELKRRNLELEALLGHNKTSNKTE